MEMKSLKAAWKGSLLALTLATATGPLVLQPAQAQAQPLLYCFVSPNSSPGGPLGLCSSNFPSSTYSAFFEVRNLPSGDYSFVWSNSNGQLLSCTGHSCSVSYLGNLQTRDTIHVNYVNLQTGASDTLSRDVVIGGGPL